MLPNRQHYTLHCKEHKGHTCLLCRFVSKLSLHLLNINNNTPHFTRFPLKPDIPTCYNSVDPDQMASKKPSDQDLHCFPCGSWSIIINVSEQTEITGH